LLGKRKRLQSNEIIRPVSKVDSSISTSTIQSQDAASPDSALKNNFSGSLGQVHDLLERFVKSAYQSYLRGDPAADHLLTLIKVNVFRAFMQNMQLIGWSAYWMGYDAISPFSITLLRETSSQDNNSHIPPNLRPTRVQKTIIHQRWLDLFPSPKMRDNLIEAGKNWDADQLFYDIMGFWGGKALDAGLVVWGEPWDVRNWEVTEPFLKKWQWVVRDCPELMTATNTWRARRGEKLIFRYI
jgi:hypothetical protein